LKWSIFVNITALLNYWGTALQVGRSRVRFPMVPLEFSIDIILPTALWSGVDSTSKRNEYLGDKGGWYIGLSTLTPSYADCLEMWEPKSLSRPLMGLLYLHLYLYIITGVLKTVMEMIPVNIMTSIHVSNFLFKNLSFCNSSVFLCTCLTQTPSELSQDD
jgi:hypothetical protein